MKKNIEFWNNWKSELNSTLFNSSSFCIALFKIDGTLIFANEAMNLLFKGNPIDSFINPTFNKLTKIKNNKALIFEGFLTIGNYNSINTSITAKVFRKNNEILVLGGVDAKQLLEQNENMHHLNREISNLQREIISEKQLLENTLSKLNEVNAELNNLDTTKNKLFSIIAHDLKNPFNSILGFSELLAINSPDYTTDKIQKFAKIIYKASENTYTLLENLLGWSRLQTGNLIPSLSRFNAQEVVLEVQLLCEPLAFSKSIRLMSDIDSPIFINADKMMFHTVLRNLVTNAIKFTHPKGEVKIQSIELEKEILFMVSDTGVGIEPQYISNIFAIENELTKKGTANEKGTGLGLMLCKEFIEAQQGEIWVESDIGVGSIFKFTLLKSI